MNDNDLTKGLWDKVSTNIDAESICKGASGLSIYAGDPQYRPQLTMYYRGGHAVTGTVYKKDNLPVLKEKHNIQKRLEKEKELKGKKVGVQFQDEKGNVHKTNNATVKHHDDDHIHVELNDSLKDKDGKTVHKKGKVVKIPKTSNKKWTADHGANHITDHEEDKKDKKDKIHEKLVKEDEKEVKKDSKKDDKD